MENNKINNPEKKINISKYEDISVDEVSMKTLNTGLWWLKNRKKLKNTITILLTAISIVSWGYTLYGYGEYLFRGMAEDRQLAINLVNNNVLTHETIKTIGARPLSASRPNIILNNKKYDFYSVVTNLNKSYSALFSYCFMDGIKEIECNESFILPKERKNILSFAKTIDYTPRNTKFIIKSTVWKRINKKEIPNWESFKNEHINFKINDLTFTPANSSGLSDKLNLSVLSFSITNQTPYSYWEVPLTISLLNRNRIIGINKYTLENFVSNEEREVKLTWPGNINASKIDITEDINILNNAVYINP